MLVETITILTVVTLIIAEVRTEMRWRAERQEVQKKLDENLMKISVINISIIHKL